VRQLLALLVAAALIGAAILVRDLIDDGGGGGDDDGSPARLLCATEVAIACTELAEDHDIVVDVVAAGDSVSALTAADATPQSVGYDGWLTLSRDAEIVIDARERAQLPPVLESPSDPIGRSPLVLAIWNDRADVLAPRCGDEITWRCIGDVAGQPWEGFGGQVAWGDVKPGHADPSSTAEGLSVIGQAAAQFFNRTDLSRDDYEDDAFLDWFTRLERAVPTGTGVGNDSAFALMLTAGPAAYDVVGTSEAVAGPLLSRASRDRRSQVTLAYPAPVATVDVVFAPVVDGDGDLADLVTGDDGRAALARAGFRVDGEDRAPGIPDEPELPSRSNLPDAGALEALLQTWREVTG
jgi:hypothetical protein